VLLQATGVLLPEVSAHVNIIDMQVSNAYVSLPKLVAYLKETKPDVLLSALELTSLMVLLARRLSKIKTRIVVRVSVAISRHQRSRIKKVLERQLVSLVYPWADRIVAVSRDSARDLSEFANIPIHRIQTIYNPTISNDMLRQAEEPIEHSFYGHGQPPVILGVGRLTEQKGFSTLIRAFGIVHKKMPARLLILGEGNERAGLESLIHSLGLDGVVDLPGYVTNPFSYMKNSAVFTLSSRWEGLPNVLIQALACGSPAVSTDCPTGPREILDGGKYGHLVSVGDPEALAQAILRSLQGDYRKPPAEWLDQFRVEPVIQQYLKIMGLA
jgi:glycosyltransferase involved in cell wall biosynthesis